MSDADSPETAENGTIAGAPLGSFAEARTFRLELDLRATPKARLAWLEEAIRLAHRSGALPRLR